MAVERHTSEIWCNDGVFPLCDLGGHTEYELINVVLFYWLLGIPIAVARPNGFLPSILCVIRVNNKLTLL